MDERREKLIALVLGDIPGDDARALEARLATDADLQAERALLENTIAAVRAVPGEDASDATVQRLMKAVGEPEPSEHDEGIIEQAIEAVAEELVEDGPAKIIRVNFLLRRVLPRVAAVAVIVFVLGIAVMFTPRVDLAPEVARVDGASVTDGELVESRAGSPRTISFATGEVLLDGASAVRVYGTGKYSAPRFEVERGRMVLTASGDEIQVAVAGKNVQIERGGMLAISYDRAYANISDNGSLVEVQRMPISEVAALAEKAYGLKLDLSGIPENIRRNRVTFYGSELSKDEFLESFVEASSKHGIRFGKDQNSLSYTGASRVFPNEEWALEIAVLEGSAEVVGGDDSVALSADDAASNSVVLDAAEPDRLSPRSLEPAALNDSVVWAAAAGHELGGRLKNVRSSADSLPGGTVIYADKLVLQGDMGPRIFKLDGPDFDFPLPGGRKGRVVQLMSNGALFEVKGEVVREFVPFSQIKE